MFREILGGQLVSGQRSGLSLLKRVQRSRARLEDQSDESPSRKNEKRKEEVEYVCMYVCKYVCKYVSMYVRN